MAPRHPREKAGIRKSRFSPQPANFAGTLSPTMGFSGTAEIALRSLRATKRQQHAFFSHLWWTEPHSNCGRSRARRTAATRLVEQGASACIHGPPRIRTWSRSRCPREASNALLMVVSRRGRDIGISMAWDQFGKREALSGFEEGEVTARNMSSRPNERDPYCGNLR